MWVLPLWVWLELPLTNSLVKKPLEEKKFALVIAVSGTLHLRSQHSCENVIMESSGDT